MKRLFDYIMFIGIAGLAICCAEKDEPVVDPPVIGNWVVVEFFTEKQIENSDLIEKLIIERDGNFILEDGNGVLTVGTWTSSESSLSLNPSEGDAIELQIITMTYNKAHMIQDLSSPVIGDIQIRYLMNNFGEGDYF